jgi:hypothetical protein
MKKRFIIRKYVMAESARDALTKDKITPVDEIFVDDKWLEEHTKSTMGFKQHN